MAYNEQLANRISEKLSQWKIHFIEKKMFGGLAFMIKDKMCIGVMKNEMMLRVMDDHYEQLIEMNYVMPMEFTGRVLKGFLMIQEAGFEQSKDLDKWLKLGIEFGEKGILKTKNKK